MRGKTKQRSRSTAKTDIFRNTTALFQNPYLEFPKHGSILENTTINTFIKMLDMILRYTYREYIKIYIIDPSTNCPTTKQPRMLLIFTIQPFAFLQTVFCLSIRLCGRRWFSRIPQKIEYARTWRMTRTGCYRAWRHRRHRQRRKG